MADTQVVEIIHWFAQIDPGLALILQIKPVEIFIHRIENIGLCRIDDRCLVIE